MSNPPLCTLDVSWSYDCIVIRVLHTFGKRTLVVGWLLTEYWEPVFIADCCCYYLRTVQSKDKTFAMPKCGQLAAFGKSTNLFQYKLKDLFGAAVFNLEKPFERTTSTPSEWARWIDVRTRGGYWTNSLFCSLLGIDRPPSPLGQWALSRSLNLCYFGQSRNAQSNWFFYESYWKYFYM